jgi:hypothetical protein
MSMVSVAVSFSWFGSSPKHCVGEIQYMGNFTDFVGKMPVIPA